MKGESLRFVDGIRDGVTIEDAIGGFLGAVEEDPAKGNAAGMDAGTLRHCLLLGRDSLLDHLTEHGFRMIEDVTPADLGLYVSRLSKASRDGGHRQEHIDAVRLFVVYCSANDFGPSGLFGGSEEMAGHAS